MGGAVALWIIAGAAGLYFWTLSRAAGNLIVLPGNLTGFAFAGASPVISATLLIQNTSNLSFTVNSIAGNVTSDGTLIGNISSFIPAEIPANGRGVVPIDLALLPIGLVNEIINIVTGGSGSRTLVINGSMNANGMQSAFEVTFKVGV